MCALRCQLTVRIEGGPRTRPTSSNPLCSSWPLSTSSHPIPLIQLFQQLPPHTCVVCGHQKSPGSPIYDVSSANGWIVSYRIARRMHVFVCVTCVTHMSPFVSHQVGSHTQLAPHKSTELHRGKERVPGVDVLYSFRRSLPLNALVASHTCRMHQRVHRTQTQ